MKLVSKAKPKHKPEPVIDEIGDTTVNSGPSERREMKLEYYLPPGKSEREVLAWFQKVFDFYFASYEVKVHPPSEE